MSTIKATSLLTDTIKTQSGGTFNFAAPKYESSWVQINTGGNYFFTHGLGRQPYLVRAYIRYGTADNNAPWVLVGDLGVWGSNSGSDYGVVAGVSNSLICVAVGEGGVSTDWGGSSGTSQNGFPANNDAFENFLNNYGQNSGNDFMDTPTETAGTWNNPYCKVYAW